MDEVKEKMKGMKREVIVKYIGEEEEVEEKEEKGIEIYEEMEKLKEKKVELKKIKLDNKIYIMF